LESNCDCDEYPFASTKQGGEAASIRFIDSSDNRSAGAKLGAFYYRERVKDGDFGSKFWVKP